MKKPASAAGFFICMMFLVALYYEDTILDLFNLLLAFHAFDRGGKGNPYVIEQAIAFHDRTVSADVIKGLEDIL